MDSTDMKDLFHAMRFAAKGVVSDPNDSDMTFVESQALALAKLLEQAFDIIDSRTDPPSLAEKQILSFLLSLVKLPDDTTYTDAQPRMTSCYAILWSLGYGNDRQEIYEGSVEIATSIVTECDIILQTPREKEVTPVVSIRGSKPQLVHKKD